MTPPPRRIEVPESPPLMMFSEITLLLMLMVPSLALEIPPPLAFEFAAPGAVTSLWWMTLPITFRVPEPPFVMAPPIDVAWLSARRQLMTLSVPLLLLARAPPLATMVPPTLSVKMLSITFTKPAPSFAIAPPALMPAGRPFSTRRPEKVTSDAEVTRKIRKSPPMLLRRTVILSIPGLMMRMFVLRSGRAFVRLIVQRFTDGSQFGCVEGILKVISSSPASAFARWIAARKLHWSPLVAGSVSQPAFGSRLSASLLTLTRIEPAKGSNVVVRGVALLSVAKLVAGNHRMVSKMTISACEIARRMDEGGWIIYLLMTFPLKKLDIDCGSC